MSASENKIQQSVMFEIISYGKICKCYKIFLANREKKLY